jgi:predicted ATPase
MMAVFTRIEAKGYRCLREVSQTLRRFEILVGANASGKSTFLDAVAFVGDLIREGVHLAVQRRTTNFEDLVWGRRNASITFRIDAEIPQAEMPFTATRSEANCICYTVSVRLDTNTRKLEIAYESLSIFSEENKRAIIARSGDVVVYTSESGVENIERQRLRNQSSLKGLPSDSDFPATAWFRDLLEDGIKTVNLDSRELVKPSPLGRSNTEDRIGGGDLPWWIDTLQRQDSVRFRDWVSQVQTALPDIRKVESVLQQWNNERFVRVEYNNGLAIPSWMLSEGTLRLLALTILAYLPEPAGVYLVEEPENGVHPSALETIYNSLSSVYESQVLVTSHSPVLLSMALPEHLLCFAASADGTKIIRGSEHPALQDWRGEVSLGTLVASGILG